jgi:extracellular elastinolytic metalloproteinase
METSSWAGRGKDGVTQHRLKRRLGSLAAATAAMLLILPAPATLGVGQVLGSGVGSDFDARTGQVAPLAAQLAKVSSLGATATWNRFGTPHSLIRYGGFLATGLAGNTAADAARSWLETNKALFRLNSASASSLALVSDNGLVQSSGHAVLFRQMFGGVPAAQDGLIAMGLVGSKTAGWKLAYVSSTNAASAGAPAAATITAAQAWVAAAHDAGLPGAVGDLAKAHPEADWTVFTASGYPQLQRARLRALPIPGAGVRPVFETDVQFVQGAKSIAFVSMVDAVSKKIWFRWNAVDDAAAEPIRTRAAATDAPVSGFFAGTTTPTGCGPDAPIPTPVGTQTIDVAASANVPADDIVLKLIKNGTTIVSADTATSPESIHYAPSGGVPIGNYAARVCAFTTGQIFDYTGFWVTNDQAVSQTPYPPEWKAFKVSPKLDYTNTDIRIVDCWEKTLTAADCDLAVKNTASRAPWDFDVQANAPTFTSIGNNAKTAQAWLSPLTPSENYSPPSTNRKYYFNWTNQWYTSRCNPTNFTSPARNDIDAAIINLFVGHNRFHDFSYFLGFTEQAWNMQQSNFGNGQPGPFPGNENDPETGNVQAGAVSGGAPSYEGRDNANQITLQDGVPGITNQYLFQPIAGSFYSPCIDGDMDTTVFGHEYTHAISNRMVGGPDSGLTGDQSGAMGESWSDLDALEYLHEFGYQPPGGASEWALGPYATGNPTVGIRNYALDKNPLNYSDVGYDSACNAPLVGPPVEPACPSRSEVHSDGEIWNAVNFDIRNALVKKYDASYSSTNATLQKSCANGVRPAELCPGNRRWIQIVYDAWLMMPPDVSMLGARDAYLAADVMRFGGANQKDLWHAFARRGMGQTASTGDTDDPDPKPGWSSPKETNGKLVFNAVDENGNAVKAKVFVGDFEAAVTPAADTDPATALSNQITIVPDRYSFIAAAPGYGHLRFATTATTATNTITLHFYTNLASKSKGGVASGNGGNFNDLIDDTEATDWAVVGTTNVVGSKVTVKLAHPGMVDIVQVSSMLHPRDDADDYDNIAQSRFTALRSFEIWGCLASAANSQCSGSAGWTKAKTFINAFPASIPRPLMPNMIIKQFEVDIANASHIRLVVLDNQCTGNPAFRGEQDNDPSNATDCVDASDQETRVRVAELQAMAEEPFAKGGYQTKTVFAWTEFSSETSASARPSGAALPTITLTDQVEPGQ